MSLVAINYEIFFFFFSLKKMLLELPAFRVGKGMGSLLELVPVTLQHILCFKLLRSLALTNKLNEEKGKRGRNYKNRKAITIKI